MKLKSKDGEDVFVNMMRQLFIFKEGKCFLIFAGRLTSLNLMSAF